ncbi:MAG: (E)-4-hydroxy-3-methylbut-2-enyl-diphosphate synthase [Breznakibacter sp.]
MKTGKIPQIYCHSLFGYSRYETVEVKIGQTAVGGRNPVRVQSMTTTGTMDTEATVQQAMRIFDAGGELVRITAQGRREALNLEQIRTELRLNGYKGPLVADIHFNPNAAEVAAALIEKVRINPGNFASGAKKFREHDSSDEAWQEGIEIIKEKLLPFLEICKEHGTAIRIGVNHGSLSDRIMSRFGDTPEGMVESCMEYLRICQSVDFHRIVLSIKASNTRIMVHTVRLLVATMAAEGMAYPLHLGVTEAGNGEDGRIKSAVGIGALLADGIGDTIRVSLTEDPELEIPVARKLVNHFNPMSVSDIEPVVPIGFTPYQYNRLKTKAVLQIGGNNLPVVIQEVTDPSSPILSVADAPDYFFTTVPRLASELAGKGKNCIVPIDIYKQLGTQSVLYPLVNISEICYVDKSEPFFLLLGLSDLTDELIAFLRECRSVVILARSTHTNVLAEMRAFIWRMHGKGIDFPIVLHRDYRAGNAEDLQVTIGAELGVLFLDGMADGVFATGRHIDEKVLLSAQFGLLQASRVRFSKTEYISCPGCGRTLFALQHVTETIKQRTSHLKGLKIGIMGCIVNGIGEMADADYGYVGSGPDKVSLFKQKELVKRNIPTNEALDELIALIKENGDWVEP